MEAGLEDEVRGLVTAGYGFDLPAMSGVGYGQFAPYLAGEATLDSVVGEIKRATRRFVRHQANWFRPGDARIHWLEGERCRPVHRARTRLRWSWSGRFWVIRNSRPPSFRAWVWIVEPVRRAVSRGVFPAGAGITELAGRYAMKCPHCQTENPGGARFCFHCGAALAPRCANCETELQAGAHFCMNCGQPVGTSTPTDEARLTRLAAATPVRWPRRCRMPRIWRASGER